MTGQESRKFTSEEQKLYDGLREKLEEYVQTVDTLPYSHNLISLVLREADRKLGRDIANKLIEEFDLESLGYNKIEARGE